MEPERLSKVMARMGLCSRREADAFIERGLVFVDGRRVAELGIKVLPGQQITLDPAASARQAERVTILLNKPVGYVSGQPEKGYSPAVALVREENRFEGDRSPVTFSAEHLVGLAPAGRLDIDSRGLLVLTQDGRAARRIIGEDSDIEKEYLVRVGGTVTENVLDRLRHGLELDGKPLLPAKVRILEPGLLQFVLREGKKRQIRRMCVLVGLGVQNLKRVRIGRVRLGTLPEGQWRYLAPGEQF